MSESQDPGDDLQEVSQQLQVLSQVESELETQLQAAQSRRQDVNDAIDALEELETDSVVQVPVGGDTYVRARIDDIDEVITSLGADFAAEQTREDALELLDDRLDQIGDGIEEIQTMLNEVRDDLEAVQGRAQQLRQQMAQRQRQQGGDDLLGNLGGGAD